MEVAISASDAYLPIFASYAVIGPNIDNILSFLSSDFYRLNLNAYITGYIPQWIIPQITKIIFVKIILLFSRQYRHIVC